MTDALVIAKWIDRNARAAAGRARHLSGAAGDMLQRCAVADAELVLIERGLRRVYGDALHKIVAAESGVGDFPDGDWDATMATAKLKWRVAALAAVIRAQEPDHA